MAVVWEMTGSIDGCPLATQAQAQQCPLLLNATRTEVRLSSHQTPLESAYLGARNALVGLGYGQDSELLTMARIRERESMFLRLGSTETQ